MIKLRRGDSGRGRVRVAACVALAAGAVGLAGGGTAGADAGEADGFSGVLARADIASVEYVDPSAPAVPGGQVVYATPGTAQATLDSLGTSKAFASTPYPGDTVTALPGTANGVFAGGPVPPFPGYPFIAQSSHPTQPSGEGQYGPFGVSTRSEADRSVAEATAGVFTGEPSVASSRAAADVQRQADGAATALARSQVHGFAYGTVFRIGDVTSEARVTARPNSTAKKEASLTLGAVSINGVPVELTRDGFRVADQTAPFDASVLTKQLAAAGIVVEYRPGTETAAGITSASLAVTYAAAFPGRPPVKTTLVLGQVTAAAQTVALTFATPSSEPPPTGPVDPPGSATEAPAPAPSPTPQPATPVGLPAGIGGGVTGQAPAAVPSLGESGGSAALSAPPTVGLRRSPLPAAPASSVTAPSARRFYLLVVVAGGLALVGTGLCGRFSVRRPVRPGAAA